MRTKNAALMVTAVLVLGLFTVPASANKVKDKGGLRGVKDTGLIAGPMTVGKLRTACLHDGSSAVIGSGIGLPNQTKNVYWEIGNADTATASSLAQPGKVGIFKACGRMTAVLSAVQGGVGAACGTSKGWDGKGTISYPGGTKDTIWLKDLGWKTGLANIIVTGRANQAPTAGVSKNKAYGDLFTGVIQLAEVAPCTTKTSAKTNNAEQGARSFTVRGTYTIANGEYVDPNTLPGTCKSGLASGCAYAPKKPGKSG